MNAILSRLRKRYHRSLANDLCRMREGGVPNIADANQQASVFFARGVFSRLGIAESGPVESLKPQEAGRVFTEITLKFLQEAFNHLNHLRPGPWQFAMKPHDCVITRFAQFSHLADVARILDEHPQLKTAMGGDYLVTPDIVVFREAVGDEEINLKAELVSSNGLSARLTPFRASNSVEPNPLLLASISLKWTIRSDRAQNTRTEALNLIRNRKGRVPHIVVVTMEPLPTRIASLAMGTGDIDCTYHATLNELVDTVRSSDREDQREILENLVAGSRLRDISDLPFDLAL